MRRTLLKRGAAASVLAAAAFGAFALSGITPPEKLTDNQSVSLQKSITLQTRADVEYSEIHEWFIQGSTATFSVDGKSNADKCIIKNVGAQNSTNTKYTGNYVGLSGVSVKCTKGLKLEGNTKLSFTTLKPSVVVIAQSTSSNSGNYPKFDETTLTANDGTEDSANSVRVFTIENVAAGEHSVTRGGSEAGILYVGVGYYAKEAGEPDDANIKWDGDEKITYKVRDAVPALPTFVNGGDYPVTFTSSNNAVATVSEEGEITAYNTTIGTAIITATVEGDEAKTYATTSKSVTIECVTNVKSVNAGVSADEPLEVTGLNEMKSLDSTGATAAGTIFCDDDFLKVTSPAASKVSNVSSPANIWGTEYKNYLNVRAKAAPTSADVIGQPESGKDGAPIVIEPKKDMTLVVYARRQALEDKALVKQEDDVEKNEITETHYFVPKAEDGKALYIVNQADLVRVPETIYLAGYQDSSAQYAYTASLYELKAGEKYTGYSIATSYGIFAFGYIIDGYVAPCKTPTAEVSAFNFEKKGYSITFKAAAGETLMVSKDGAEAVEMESPVTLWNVANASAYAVAEGLEDSEVVEASVPENNYDPEKPYIAWVYIPTYDSAKIEGYTDNALIKALKEIGNVVLVEGADGDKPADDLKNADLIVCGEAMAGAKTFSNGMKDFVGKTNMINLKFFNYTSGRWSWGAPANPGKDVTTIYPDQDYKVLKGVIYNDKYGIQLFDGEFDATKNHVQTADLSKLEGHTILASSKAGDKTTAALHCTDKFLGIGLSSDDWKNYGDNAVTIVTNAANMLLAGEDLAAPAEIEVIHNQGTINFGAVLGEEGHSFKIEGVEGVKKFDGELLDINSEEYKLAPGTVHKITPYVNGVAKEPVHVLTAPKILHKETDIFGDTPFKVFEVVFAKAATTKMWVRFAGGFTGWEPTSKAATRAQQTPAGYTGVDEYLEDSYFPQMIIAPDYVLNEIGMSNPTSYIATSTDPNGNVVASKEVAAPTYEDVETYLAEVIGEEMTGAKMYDLNGREVKGEATPGIYILVKGKKSVKVIIR